MKCICSSQLKGTFGVFPSTPNSAKTQKPVASEGRVLASTHREKDSPAMWPASDMGQGQRQPWKAAWRRVDVRRPVKTPLQQKQTEDCNLPLGLQ